MGWSLTTGSRQSIDKGKATDKGVAVPLHLCYMVCDNAQMYGRCWVLYPRRGQRGAGLNEEPLLGYPPDPILFCLGELHNGAPEAEIDRGWKSQPRLLPLGEGFP
jgi:hypothetical protein